MRPERHNIPALLGLLCDAIGGILAGLMLWRALSISQERRTIDPTSQP
jgi:hypothetical protein